MSVAADFQLPAGHPHEYTKDTDGNNLAAFQACQAAKERLRLGGVGKSISITVLRRCGRLQRRESRGGP